MDPRREIYVLDLTKEIQQQKTLHITTNVLYDTVQPALPTPEGL
jgi:hypothetical protein